jgi:maltose alpha-D-glucosyltransferase/alpha-amylase
MRQFISSKKSDAILLAEANVPPREMDIYLHEDERMHMLFNFFVNQFLFLSLATGTVQPLVRALYKLPPLAGSNQWLNFLRHHDELTLSILNDDERQKVFARFGPDATMRIYERGIRRRLAPMLNGNTRLIEFCYSLLFSLPGIPLIRYGDEIGMGDDLSLPGRTSVRTPMQWSNDMNGGFSTTHTNKLVHPVITGGDYGYEKVNATNAKANPSSLLNWMQRLIGIRKQCPEIGLGNLQILPCDEKGVLIHSYEWEGQTIGFVHNFSADDVIIANPFHDESLALFQSEKEIPTTKETVTLKGYSYKWFRTKKD